jgi:hypothetical protein
MEYHKMLQAMDKTAILYKWEQSNVTKADACLKPTALPTTVTGHQSYADSLCPSADGGDCWCNIRVGFSKPPDEFMAELRAQAGTRKWVAKKQPLQSAHTENVGWINHLPQSTDVDFWADCINSWIEKNIECDDDTPPLVIGLDYRAIYHDGLGQAAQNRLSQKEKWAKKAVHVVCKCGEKIRVTGIIRSFLQCKCFCYLGSYPLRLIPMLPYGYSPIFQAKYQEATQKHMKLTYFGSLSQTTFAFTGPNKRISFLDGSPTIRSLVLGMKVRGTKKPLFLTLNPATKGNEKGGFVITYCVKYEKEAVKKLTNLAAYFHHHCGDGSLERFSPEAWEQADHTKWDTEND